ncbi:MAG: DMT family transporter, partial [Gammaproteobacteria bacterium]
METLTRRQWALLIPLTIAWGINWPIMKVGVTDLPPLTFRAMSLWLGVPVLAVVLRAMRLPFRVPRRHWPELLWLSATNMFVWHVCIIIALRHLSGGRAAILGYTMPVFSAILGAMLFSTRLSARAWMGVAAAALGVTFLLWHEFTGLAGS